MKTLVVSYLVALVVLAILDALWLGVVSREFYKARLGQMLLDKPIWSAAILFYLVHAAGIAVFALPLALNAGTWPYALLYGERSVTSVTNNTRADGHAFLREAAAAQVRVHTRSFPFEALNEALRAVKESRVDGAAVVDMI